MKSTVFCLFVLIFASFLPAKNVKIISTIDPFNYEQIDVEIEGDRMIIPAGLGGAEIYDISDPLNPESIGNIELRTCAWGRTYNWDLFGDNAIGTARDCGFGIYDIDPLSSPRYLSHYKTENAWSLAINKHQNVVYVADGDAGIKIISLLNMTAPHVLGKAETSGTARDIRFQGNYLYVAVGTAGVDVFDITNPSEPVLVANFPTSGFTSRVAVHGDLVSLSSWDRLHVLRFVNNNLELIGYKNSGGRLMAVGSPGGNVVYGAEWEVLQVYEIGEISEPDIDFSTRVLNFGQVEFGQSKTLPLEIENNGNTSLQISGIAFTYDDYTTPTTAFVIEPHGKKIIDIVYAPTRSFAGGNIIVLSNDADEEQAFIKVQGNNTREVQEGDVAANFALPTIANGSGLMSLEDLRGRVVVLAMFASW